MNTYLKMIALAVTALATSGCLGLKTYVDDGLPKIGYEELRTETPHGAVTVDVQWLTDGVPNPDIGARMKESVIEIVERTGLFSQVLRGDVGSTANLQFIIDNAGGGREGSVALAVITFGLVGVGTTDHYSITATFSHKDGSPHVVELQHTLHATIGMRSGPPGVEPMTIRDGVDRLIEESVLYALKEIGTAQLVGGNGETEGERQSRDC